jgi:TolB-like protein
MIRRCIIHILLLAGLAQAQMTVAVTDFKNRSGAFHLDAWETSIAEYLKADLSASDQLIVVERENLGAVLKEQALGQTGVIDPQEAQEIGGLLGARYVITGVIQRNDEQIDIHAQIIQVATGQLRSERVSAPDDKHFNEMMVLLTNNIRFNLIGDTAYRPALGLNPYPAGYFLAGTVLSGAGTLILHNAYHNKIDEYRSAQDLADFDDKYDSANQLYKTRNVMAVITGIGLAGTIYCWIKNQSAGEIRAGDKPLSMRITPDFSTDFRSCYAGVTIRF